MFTGGVGERAAEVRRLVAERLAFVGVALDEERNARAVPDTDVSAAQSAVSTLVLVAREDLEMAGQVRAVLSRS